MKVKESLAIVSMCLGGALVSGTVSGGILDVNGVEVSERVFNDFPGSTLTTTNNFPVLVEFRDENMINGGFANRHDALLSADGGTTPLALNTSDGFDVSVDVTLEVGSTSPRKEAGMRVNSNITGNGLFIINSDAGEIVAFGGPLEFFSFNNTFGESYVAGDTILMRMIYRPGEGVAGTVEYIVDVGDGPLSSGELEFTNTEGGIADGTNVGFYGQFSPADENDFGVARFENIRAVPEPASAALVALGALGMIRRRTLHDG